MYADLGANSNPSSSIRVFVFLPNIYTVALLPKSPVFSASFPINHICLSLHPFKSVDLYIRTIK